MRRILLPILLLALIASAGAAYAQSPPGINYQGIARNNDGKPLAQKEISIRINIVKDNHDGDVEYAEVHTVTTNAFGLFTLVIGSGSVETGTFENITWSLGNKWLRVEMDADGGSAFQNMGAQQFMSVPYAFYAKYSGSGMSGPPQDLNIEGDVLMITGNDDATPINLAPYLDNTDAQTLTLNASDQLAISGGNNVNLAPYKQDLSITGNNLSLTNDPTSTPINLAPYLDNTDAQTLTLNASDQLAISGGNNVNLAPYKQDLSITGNNLSLTNDPTSTPINLSPYLDNTDAQTLTINASDQLAISGGNNVNLAPYKQDLSITGNNLSLTNDPTSTPINLAPYLDNTDAQTLTINASDQLAISGGNNVNLAPYKQDLSITGNNLSLTSDPTSTPINLAPYLDNTDAQTLTINASDQLAISGGNNVNLAPYKQDLSITGNNLSLTSDPTSTPIDLAPYLDNTDAQTLTLNASDQLAISGGNNVNLAPYKQDLSINTSTDQLSLTNDPTAVPIDLSPYKQSLHLSTVGNIRTITIDNGAGVGFSVDDGDSDATNELQSLSYNAATKALSLSASPGAPVTINETQNLNQVLTQGTDANGQKITNLGTPTANTDAATKMYVDNGDAAINSRISANYSFKSGYTYSTVLAVSEVTMALTDVFDDFNVVGTSTFQAQVSGTYMFVLDGTTTGLLGASAGVNLYYNGTKYPVSLGSNNQYNSTFMFKLNAGETVSVVVTGLGINSSVAGSFFGYKLL